MKSTIKFQLEKVDKHEAGRIIRIHPDGLKTLRRSGLMTEHVHYWQPNSRTTRYNKKLLESAAVFGFDSPEHQRLVDEFVLWASSLAGTK